MNAALTHDICSNLPVSVNCLHLDFALTRKHCTVIPVGQTN